MYCLSYVMCIVCLWCVMCHVCSNVCDVLSVGVFVSFVLYVVYYMCSVCGMYMACGVLHCAVCMGVFFVSYVVCMVCMWCDVYVACMWPIVYMQCECHELCVVCVVFGVDRVLFMWCGVVSCVLCLTGAALLHTCQLGGRGRLAAPQLAPLPLAPGPGAPGRAAGVVCCHLLPPPPSLGRCDKQDVLLLGMSHRPHCPGLMKRAVSRLDCVTVAC